MNTRRFSGMLCLLATLFLLPSCSRDEYETDEDGTYHFKPETPIGSDDWQWVSPDGGTLTKDDFSIDFPSGTFDTDTKVALTKTKKGKNVGSYEVSDFIQVALPATTASPYTIRIKGEPADDVVFVYKSKGWCVSGLREADIEHELETSYENGEYVTRMPVSDNEGIMDNISFTVGLARRPGDDESKSIATKSDLSSGLVGNIYYQVSISWGAWLKNDRSTIAKVEAMLPQLGQWTKESLQIISDLGFQLDYSWTLHGKRYLYINISNNKDWGGFTQGKTCAGSDVELGIGKLLDEKTTENDIKGTIIHEIRHFFHADYDPRGSFRKGNGLQKVGDEVTMDEMMSVWIEHLMNDGQLNKSFLIDYLNAVVFGELSVTDAQLLRNPNNNKDNVKTAYQDQGYALGPFLYYLCSSGNMDSKYGFTNKSVVELLEFWRDDYMKHNRWYDMMYCLDNWLVYKHNDCFFLSGDKIDDYYVKLWRGDLIKGLNITSAVDVARPKNPDLKYNQDKKSGKQRKKGKCPVLGCSMLDVLLQNLSAEDLKDKELVITNETEGMHSYVFYVSPYTSPRPDAFPYQEVKQAQGVATGNDPIVIPCSEFENAKSSRVYILTTRTDNFYSDHGLKTYEVSVDLRKKEEEELNITSIVFKANLYAKPDNSDFGDTYWAADASSYNYETHTNVPINSTKKGKDLHVAFTNSYTYGANNFFEESLSFDIVGYDGNMNNWVINNLNAFQSIDDTSQHDYPSASQKTAMTIMDVSNLKIVMNECSFSVVPGVESFITFRATPSSGLTVSKFAAYYEDFYGQAANFSYIDDPSNSVELTIYYDKVYPM